MVTKESKELYKYNIFTNNWSKSVNEHEPSQVACSPGSPSKLSNDDRDSKSLLNKSRKKSIRSKRSGTAHSQQSSALKMHKSEAKKFKISSNMTTERKMNTANADGKKSTITASERNFEPMMKVSDFLSELCKPRFNKNPPARHGPGPIPAPESLVSIKNELQL